MTRSARSIDNIREKNHLRPSTTPLHTRADRLPKIDRGDDMVDFGVSEMMFEFGGSIHWECSGPATLGSKNGEDKDGVENVVVEVKTDCRALSEDAGESRNEVLGLSLREETV